MKQGRASAGRVTHFYSVRPNYHKLVGHAADSSLVKPTDALRTSHTTPRLPVSSFLFIFSAKPPLNLRASFFFSCPCLGFRSDAPISIDPSLITTVLKHDESSPPGIYSAYCPTTDPFTVGTRVHMRQRHLSILETRYAQSQSHYARLE